MRNKPNAVCYGAFKLALEGNMEYHKFVMVGCAVSCAFLLQGFIGLSGDMIYSPTKAKAPGYVVTTTPATAHKFVRRT